MVSREITFAASLDPKAPNLGPEGINAYVKASKERHGLTHEGLMYHMMRLLPETMRELARVPEMCKATREQLADPRFGRVDDPNLRNAPGAEVVQPKADNEQEGRRR